MKIFKSSRGLFTLAFILLILTNTVLLMGVYLNRTMEVTSHALFTQRELVKIINNKENNGVSLSLIYRTFKNKDSYSYNQPVWLDRVKLITLGFNTNIHPSSHAYRKKSSKEVFIVLEYDGEAYKKTLILAEENFAQKKILYNAKKYDATLKANYEDAKLQLNMERTSKSKLFAIDAGLSYEKLRQMYPNKTKYIIVKGHIQLVLIEKPETEKLFASIQKLSVKAIYLPYKFKHIFFKNDTNQYEVEVKYGSRYEPWISSVKKD